MAEYHVGCGAFGIYAGALEPRNKTLWRNKSDVTHEALCAVAQHLLFWRQRVLISAQAKMVCDADRRDGRR